MCSGPHFTGCFLSLFLKALPMCLVFDDFKHACGILTTFTPTLSWFCYIPVISFLLPKSLFHIHVFLWPTDFNQDHLCNQRCRNIHRSLVGSQNPSGTNSAVGRVGPHEPLLNLWLTIDSLSHVQTKCRQPQLLFTRQQVLGSVVHSIEPSSISPNSLFNIFS